MPKTEHVRRAPCGARFDVLSVFAKFPRFVLDSSRSYAKLVFSYRLLISMKYSFRCGSVAKQGTNDNDRDSSLRSE